MNIEQIEGNINAITGWILSQFAIGTNGWYLAFFLLTVIVLVDFGRAIHGKRKRSLESRQFLFLCVPVLLWVALHISLVLSGIGFAEPWTKVLSDALRAFTLALLCLHVWSQVSYKPITAAVVVRFLVVPVILLIITILIYYYPGINPSLSIQEVGIQTGQMLSLQSLESLLFTVFSLFILARSYLLCFNVFYQMPKHMRLSTHKLLLAISSVAIIWFLETVAEFKGGFADSLTAVSYIVMLYAFFAAFYIANSSNVIVTSRDFVFSSLSTVVITVSLKGNILDWNKKDPNSMALPKPKYMESYNHYRQRIIDTCNGVTSPHDENIITATINGVEQHYLFTPHDIGHHGRDFGNLVEIGEVTKIYSVLRYLEEIAMYDNLTGLKNRNAYIDTVKHIISPENMPLGIVIGDVNNLKNTNDTLGHLCGDRLLTTITSIIDENAPQDAPVFRIGGDELVVLVPRTNAKTIQQFVYGVFEGCSKVKDPDYGEPSISWGYALMTDPSQDYNEVFLSADAMMYKNKQSSKIVSISGIVNIDQPAEAAVAEAEAGPAEMGGAADAAAGAAGTDPGNGADAGLTGESVAGSELSS